MGKNYTYIKCADCIHKDKPTCRKTGYKWSPSVVPGCMVDMDSKDSKNSKDSGGDKPKAYVGFSHRYVKLCGQTSAELLAIRPIRIDAKTDHDLIDYDTTYVEWTGGYLWNPKLERKHFKLEHGDYLQLIFLGNKGIPFCTIRRQGDHWQGVVGNIFEIRIKGEKKP